MKKENDNKEQIEVAPAMEQQVVSDMKVDSTKLSENNLESVETIEDGAPKKRGRLKNNDGDIRVELLLKFVPQINQWLGENLPLTVISRKLEKLFLEQYNITYSNFAICSRLGRWLSKNKLGAKQVAVQRNNLSSINYANTPPVNKFNNKVDVLKELNKDVDNIFTRRQSTGVDDGATTNKGRNSQLEKVVDKNGVTREVGVVDLTTSADNVW